MRLLTSVLIWSAVFTLQLANADAWSKDGGSSSKPTSGKTSSGVKPAAKARPVAKGGAACTDRGTVCSDIRLKRDIVEVATLASGLHLYRFRYKRSEQTYVGVMAQEVMNIFPAAVTTDANGYYRVYYARLGLHMQTWKEWLGANQVAASLEQRTAFFTSPSH